MRKPSNKKSQINPAVIYRIFIFILAACLSASLTNCEEKGPEILLINPRIGLMGDILTIQGSGFGDDRDESFITIAGTSPTSSSYLSWNDEEISVRIPEFGEAGLVYVHRGRKKSNPALFANVLNLPELIEDSHTGNGPRITSIEPSSGAIGSIITILGSNFGSSRGSSGVFFSWDAESPPGAPLESRIPDFIEAFDSEFGYEVWSEREIQVRIPDGAISGNMQIRTPRGNSQDVFFEITGKPGTKIFKDKKTYIVSYSVDLRIERASIPNALYIWMPLPAQSASQRNVEVISRSPEPFVENHQGSSLFQFIDTLPRTSTSITLSYLTDVYAVESSMRTNTPVRLNRPSPLGTINILPSRLIPSEEAEIKSQATQIIGNERLLYPRAQRIYDWLISSIEIEMENIMDSFYSEDGVSNNSDTIEVTLNDPPSTAPIAAALKALQEKKADSYSASLLFCALARAAGIPSQPVAGVIVNNQFNAVRHYWAEFWIDGFGWIPVDPVLGAGSPPPDFFLREDHARFYFGSLDNQRIAFSRGERFISRMTPWGQIAGHNRGYSLQNIWEEAVEGLESYSSTWSDVTITAVY